MAIEDARQCRARYAKLFGHYRNRHFSRPAILENHTGAGRVVYAIHHHPSPGGNPDNQAAPHLRRQFDGDSIASTI
jgi:hypothetical protein